MLHRIHALVAACAVMLLASFLVPNLVSPAHAEDDCDLVLRPAASFAVAESSGLEYAIDVALEQNDEQTIAATRTLAQFRLASEGFSETSAAEVLAYLDSLIAWYRYEAAPCAPALPYEGPYTNVPASVESPYGFGGIETSTGPPIVITVTRPAGDTTVEVGRVVVDDADDLAHSGSESFVLAYFGAGLLAFGASALGMRRWMSGPVDA